MATVCIYMSIHPLPISTHNTHQLDILQAMKKMAAPFDSNAAEKSRIQPDFPSSSSSSSYWKREMMKLESPLPPPAKSRVSLSLDRAIEHELIHGRQLDPNLDPKTLRRTISNRISAQRSRMKRAQYIIDLEKKVHDLEELVSTLTPKFEAFKEKKRILQLENDSLRSQVDIRAAESKIKEDGLDEKRREIQELKESLKCNPWNSDSNSEVEMQVSGSDDKASPKPYSIEFYQERLMQVEMNQFINQELNNRYRTPPHPQHDSFIHDVDLEIDQYLNLDEI